MSDILSIYSFWRRQICIHVIYILSPSQQLVKLYYSLDQGLLKTYVSSSVAFNKACRLHFSCAVKIAYFRKYASKGGIWRFYQGKTRALIQGLWIWLMSFSVERIVLLLYRSSQPGTLISPTEHFNHCASPPHWRRKDFLYAELHIMYSLTWWLEY